MKMQEHEKDCVCYYCYLGSPEWKREKKKAFAKQRKTYCDICRERGEEWHHYKGYDAIWTERDYLNIILLCHKCHTRNHFPLRGGKVPLTKKKLYKRYLFLKRTYGIRTFRASVLFDWFIDTYGVN